MVGGRSARTGMADHANHSSPKRGWVAFEEFARWDGWDEAVGSTAARRT
jgi:hypothetical protein